VGFGWLSRVVDNFVLDAGFDKTCEGVARTAHAGRSIQDGKIQNYIRTIAVALTVLVLLLVWGCKGQ
jgi:hypothetical protein